MAKIDPGAGAWLVVCSALVLLMAPALALFYGGRAPGANAKSMLIRWIVAVPILAVQWILFGYSLAFGPTRHGLIGGLAYAGMTGGAAVRGSLPAIAFAACLCPSAVSMTNFCASFLLTSAMRASFISRNSFHVANPAGKSFADESILNKNFITTSGGPMRLPE